MAGPSIMDTLFQRTLEDLIKGIRLQLIGESAFISKAMEEIRKEIKSTDLHTKSVALQKLSYLSSLHFIDMSWAAFHCIECISSPRLVEKRIGYVSISQSFNEHTPVLLLITNQLKKDLGSVSEYDVGLALDCLANIATPDLARDLTAEVFTLLGSSKAYVRKKAIAVVFRVFEKYPDAVRICFKRLVESLDSPDFRILSAVVGVFSELAAQDPRSFLPLAPEFYRILVDSKNNWVLIKVLKIFARLAPLEPRLAKRVVEPICDHMRKTGAKSLLFECIRTVVTSLSEYEAAVKLAVSKIREFLIDDDPNLKYLGLHALSMVAANHLWVVLENKEIVIKSLSDVDINIKFESLQLVMAVVSETNVVEISKVLVNYALKSDPEFCNSILGSILSICSRNVYEIINDFDWYVSLLGEMALIPHCQKGDEIGNQLTDIGMRVKDVRPELVRVCRSLLIDPALLGNHFLHKILSAAAWVTGEFVEFSKNPSEIMDALLQPRTDLLPPPVRSVYLQSVLKVLIFCIHSYVLQRENTEYLSPSLTVLEGFQEHVSKTQDIVPESVGLTHESVGNLLETVELAVRPLLSSHEVEILERARNVLGLVDLVKQEFPSKLIENGESEVLNLIKLINDAFCEELGPVSVTGQEKVQIPDDLILLENLDNLDSICGEDTGMESSPTSIINVGTHDRDLMDVFKIDEQNKEDAEPCKESTSLLAKHRKRHGLYYLPHEGTSTTSNNDYPVATDLHLSRNDQDGEVEDFMKLTAQSLAPKKKSSHSKPRPVVVKLDEGEVVSSSGLNKMSPKPDLDLLSGAIQDVLKENELNNRKGKGKVNDEVIGLKENHQQRKKNKAKMETEATGEKVKKKSRQRHGKKKTHPTVNNTPIAASSLVIPDFLL